MEFLFLIFLSKPLWMWLVFMAIVVTLMVFDLGVLHKSDHELGVAESLKLSAFYIAIAVAFGLGRGLSTGCVQGTHYIAHTLSIINSVKQRTNNLNLFGYVNQV